MFVNLSNHPSASWSRKQLKAAMAFGEVIDIPFPDVSPQMDEQEISLLADDYLQRVRDISPDPCTVHVMGELTFSFVLVNRLQAAGYTCVASTTKRVVEILPDGSKVSKFNFVRFRNYGT